MDTDKIAYYLQLFSDLEFADVKDLIGIYKEISLKPSEIYIREGSQARKVAYIKSGLIRVYRINEKGEEVTFIVRWENQFVASHDIVFLNQPSRFMYEAMEKCELVEIDYDVLQKIVSKSPKFVKYRKDFLVKMLMESLEQLESLVLLSPEERYLEFLKSKPNIQNRVPNKYIANILGITPVSLSRIRKRIASKKH